MAQYQKYQDDPKRLAVLKAMSDLLIAEVPAVEERVYRGRYMFTKNNEVPAIALLENLDPDRFPRIAGHEDMLGHGETSENWIILVQGWVVDDKCNPTDPAYKLMADTRKALSLINKQGGNPQFDTPNTNPWFRLGGLVNKFTMEPGVARPPSEQTSAYAYFWMRVILSYAENPNDPYDHQL